MVDRHAHPTILLTEKWASFFESVSVMVDRHAHPTILLTQRWASFFESVSVMVDRHAHPTILLTEKWRFERTKIKLGADCTIQINPMEILFNDGLIQVMFDHHNYLTFISSLLAQASEDPDIIGQLEDAWYNFIDSGQVWALLVGAFFGYTFKGFTG